jgi:hypothetical protein
VTGLEPATSGVTGRHSNQLSYTRSPALPLGKGLPKLRQVARVTGLEPATSGVTGRHSNQLSYTRLRSGDTWPPGVALMYVDPADKSSGSHIALC